MLFNESFWVAISIILFMVIIFKYTKTPLDSFFIKRALSIQNKLNEALALKEEAEKLLQDQYLLYQNSTKEAEDLLALSQEEVTHMQKNAEKDLAAKLNFKKIAALEKIHTSEEKLLNKLRMEAMQLAIASSITLLHKHNFDQMNAKLIDTTIESITETFN